MGGCYHKLAYKDHEQKRFGKTSLKCLLCFNSIRPKKVPLYFPNGKNFRGKPIFMKALESLDKL